METNQPAPQRAAMPAIIPPGTRAVGVFENAEAFMLAQRMATALAESDLVPVQYKGSIANCMLAIEMANRVGTSVLMVVQNLNVIHGRPSWSAPFIIGTIKSCGKFAQLKWTYTGNKGDDSRGCIFSAAAVDTGEVLEGPEITVKMAKGEGWYSRERSKWPNMTDVMLSYRAVAFWQRLHAPDILMGMHETGELLDAVDVNAPMGPSSGTVVDGSGTQAAGVEQLNAQASAQPTRRRRRAAAEKPADAPPAATDGTQAAGGAPAPEEGAPAPETAKPAEHKPIF